MLACCAASAALPALASEASTAAKQARKAERKGQTEKAFLLYSEASTLQPRNRTYRGKAAGLSLKVAAPEASGAEPDDLVLPGPQDYFDSMTARDYASLRQPAPTPELHAMPGRFDLDLRGDSKTLFSQLARVYGLDNIFDSDYDAGRQIHFQLNQADYREALHALEAATGSFVTPVSRSLFLVAKDTPAKRNDLEQNITVSISVPQPTTTQELIEIAQAVRQTLDIQKMAWDTKSNTIVIRDRVSRAIPAQVLFENLLSYRPQVIVELQLIEIRKSDVINFGINLPNMVNVAFTNRIGSVAGTVAGSLPVNTNNPFPFGSRSYQYLSQATATTTGVLQNAFSGLFPNSLSLFSLSVNEAGTLVNFSDSRSRTMLKAELRAGDAQASTFHLGDRYPIVTSSYSAGTSVQNTATPVPAFTFEDLGISLKVTPHIHGTEEVTLDVESEFKLLTGQVANGNPLIFNRKLNSSVRLRDDEWGLIAGLVSRSHSRSTSGTLGLSQIPLLGHLFRQRARQQDDSQIVILMKPRLINLPGSETLTRTVRVGTEQRPFIPL